MMNFKHHIYEAQTFLLTLVMFLPLSSFTLNADENKNKHEIPYLQELAADYQGKPLRIVNFYIDQGTDGINSLDIETYHLTDEQRLGLDPILHLGAGIPFYILIDKDGVIVDFGEHLRPSIPETREIIDNYLLDFEH